jgi:hypothetical protein
MNRAIKIALPVMLIFFINCSAKDTFGTKEYYERITGQTLVVERTIFLCRREAFPDITLVNIFKMPDKYSRYFINPDESFRQYPLQLEYEKKRILVKWRSGDLDKESVKFYQIAMDGVDYVQQGDCKQKINIKKMIADSFGRDSTHYAYQYKTISDTVSVVVFYIINADNGLFIEITHDI